MNPFTTLPGVELSSPFHFYDSQQRPTRCDLLVQRQHNWALATERTDSGGSGLMHCATTLAASVCTAFELDPKQLVLLTHYQYERADSYYSLHFAHSDRDLFAGIRFLEGRRQSIHPADISTLVQELAQGNQDPTWILRALPFLPKLTSQR